MKKIIVMLLILAALTANAFAAFHQEYELGANANYVLVPGGDGALKVDLSATLWPVGKEDLITGGVRFDLSAFTMALGDAGMMYPYVELVASYIVGIPFIDYMYDSGFRLSGELGAGLGYRYSFQNAGLPSYMQPNTHSLVFSLPFAVAMDFGSTFTLRLGAAMDFVIGKQSAMVGEGIGMESVSISPEFAPFLGMGFRF